MTPGLLRNLTTPPTLADREFEVEPTIRDEEVLRTVLVRARWTIEGCLPEQTSIGTSIAGLKLRFNSAVVTISTGTLIGPFAFIDTLVCTGS